MEAQQSEIAVVMDQYQHNTVTSPPVKGGKLPLKKRGRAMLGNVLQKKQRGYWTSEGGDVLLEKISYAYGLSGSGAVDMISARFYAEHFAEIQLLIQEKKKPRVAFR